ncbi:MAG TPA: CHRD domain-containing protein [Vicinamibacterales bacterium]|nr:CHRD domain-containing protein [Vicinamibacterales bacterium]
MIRTRLMAGAALLIGTAACSPSPSATAASVTGPTEIVVPLNFGTHMHGEHERPTPRDTNATGQLTLKLSHDGQAIEYKLIASNIDNVVASHIHQGPVDSPGPVVVTLYTGAPGRGRHDGVLATGTITTSNLSGPLAGQSLSSLIDLIQSGNAYANVHTNDGVAPIDTGPGDYPSGEIRGQIRK